MTGYRLTRRGRRAVTAAVILVTAVLSYGQHQTIDTCITWNGTIPCITNPSP